MENHNQTITKKQYHPPVVAIIPMDCQISLQMASDPPFPGGENNSVGMSNQFSAQGPYYT